MANFELHTISIDNNNDRSGHTAKEQVTAVNGGRAACGSCLPDGGELNRLLQDPAVGDVEQHSAAPPVSLRSVEVSAHDQMRRLKAELNEKLFWKVRLWMVILFIFFLILSAALISMALCSVIHEDVDDAYDAASFEVPLYFSGSFRLANRTLSLELLFPTSNQSLTLSTRLQEELTELYSSSPALGRYFTRAEIPAFSNSSVVAQYRLSFLMPVQHEQLRRFTLSRELVYNVLRQHLYDQEPEHQGALYIDPASLEMQVSQPGISS